MEAKQRRHEIGLMVEWLERDGFIDYTQVSSSPSRYMIYLHGGASHLGDARTTHAYLSGCVDLMHMNRYSMTGGI